MRIHNVSKPTLQDLYEVAKRTSWQNNWPRSRAKNGPANDQTKLRGRKTCRLLEFHPRQLSDGVFAGSTMWTPRLDSLEGIDSVVSSAGAAVLCTVLSQYLSSREAEVPSEAFCWAILPILFTRTIRLNPSTSSSASSISLWIVAIAVAVACCYTAEIGIIYLVVRVPQLPKLTRNPRELPVHSD